jgi:ATP-dependent RNA helicase DHX8/PRP22
VKIKVAKIEGSRIRLPMKDVNQETGRDIALQIQSGANMERLGRTKNEYSLIYYKVLVSEKDMTKNSQKVKKRITSLER